MEGVGGRVHDGNFGPRARLPHLPKQQHVEVVASCCQDDAVGLVPRAVDHKHHVRVLPRLEEVEQVARDVLEVLHVAQRVEVDADGGVT